MERSVAQSAPPTGPDSMHAKCSPSSAGRWVMCPGSVMMGALYTEPSSDASREGTASHYVASTILEGHPQPAVGSMDPHGTMITIEMVEAAGEYVAAVIQTGCAHDPVTKPPELHIEKPVNAFSIHEHACWGTPDLWHTLNGNEIHVWDYKYGFGIVEAFENWQLITYASGILDHLKIDGIADQLTTVVLHIVQPRAFHIMGTHRQWAVRASDLRGYINKLAHAAATAMLPDPPTLTGGHCKYCSARHACPALQQAAMICVDLAGLSQPQELTPEAMGLEYRTLAHAEALIKARRTGIENRMIGTLQAGGTIPGYGLERGKGRAAWVKPTKEIFALGDCMGIDLRDEPSAITPAAARKKGLDPTLIAAYSAAGDKGLQLVATDNTLAARVFKQVAVTGTTTAVTAAN
jgi:hypothetical protein